MSLIRRLGEVMSARASLRRTAAAAFDRGAAAATAAFSPSPPSISSSFVRPQQQQQQQWSSPLTAGGSSRYYSPYASSAASTAAAASVAAPAPTAAAADAADALPPASSAFLRPAPPPAGQTPQNAAAPPWTHTRLLAKRKRPQKRMRCLIQTLEREHQERAAQQKQHPLPHNFRAGDVLEVRAVVPEAGRKVYTYKGVCLGRLNKGPRSWLKMYNVFPDAGGVVQHLPIYMPDLLSIKVVGKLPRTRRARLYHLLEDESSSQTYQATLPAPEPAPAAAAR